MNSKSIFYILVGYIAAYISIGFLGVIDKGVFAKPLIIFSVVDIFLIILLLKIPKIKLHTKISKGVGVTIILLSLSTLGMHIFSGIIGPQLGPTLIEISDNPSTLPLETTNRYLLKINLIVSALAIFVSFLIGFIIDKKTYKGIKIYWNYLLYLGMMVGLGMFNYVLLAVFATVLTIYSINRYGL